MWNNFPSLARDSRRLRGESEEPVEASGKEKNETTTTMCERENEEKREKKAHFRPWREDNIDNVDIVQVHKRSCSVGGAGRLSSKSMSGCSTENKFSFN